MGKRRRIDFSEQTVPAEAGDARCFLRGEALALEVLQVLLAVRKIGQTISLKWTCFSLLSETVFPKNYCLAIIIDGAWQSIYEIFDLLCVENV